MSNQLTNHPAKQPTLQPTVKLSKQILQPMSMHPTVPAMFEPHMWWDMGKKNELEIRGAPAVFICWLFTFVCFVHLQNKQTRNDSKLSMFVIRCFCFAPVQGLRKLKPNMERVHLTSFLFECVSFGEPTNVMQKSFHNEHKYHCVLWCNEHWATKQSRCNKQQTTLNRPCDIMCMMTVRMIVLMCSYVLVGDVMIVMSL